IVVSQSLLGVIRMFSAAAKKLHFTRQIQYSRPDHIFLVRGYDDNDRRAWYYVMADKGKREVFKAQNGSMQLALTDYGQILYSGFGNNPPETIRQEMEDDYGFRE